MDGVDIFWMIFSLLIFMTFLWPQLQYKMLRDARTRIIKRIERKRGTRVITLIHRQERIGLFGIPFFKYIDIDDSEQVLRAIRMTDPNIPIDLIIHTPGGMVLAAEQIAMALRDHKAKTTVIIPHFAMSGGTLIALAADEIIMDEHAVLGPVDPQITHPEKGVLPAVSILEAVRKKGEKSVSDETLILASVAEKAVNQMREFIYNLVRNKVGEEKAKEIANILTSGKWTHDYPITCEEAKKLGLNVSTKVPSEVYELMSLYPQPMQQRPSVEFIPYPYMRRREVETK